MNRLEAAHMLQGHYKVFDNGNGTYTILYHLTKEVADGSDIGVRPGIYAYLSKDKVPRNPNFGSMTKVSWLDVANLYRHTYPRRMPGQCSFNYLEEGVCQCTIIHEHDHCRKCGSVSYGFLCALCEEESNRDRLQITRLLANYYNTYKIPFVRDEETFDAMTGVYDDIITHIRTSREDFHSDG